MYCGPFVLHFVTRETPDDVVRAIQEHRGNRKPVQGMWQFELRNMLNYYRVPFSEMSCPYPRPTLAGWLRASRRCRHPKRCYIVMITGHYVVIRGRKLYDNANRKGVWLRQYNRRRKRVRAVLEIRIP